MKIGKLNIGSKFCGDIGFEYNENQYRVFKVWNSNGDIWLRPADIYHHNENENETEDHSPTYNEVMSALNKMFK